MQDDFAVIEQGVGLLMTQIWTIDDDQMFAAGMTGMCRTLWGHLRSDPFPDDLDALAAHLTGIQPNDGRELIDRLMNYQVSGNKRGVH
ncbi:hypothetical protein [Primorskyibacter sp. S87]|uniref:hypothetical protein n=1 Tax=Primorskyibacter sp. S87 TaxID=3415126 RepID=UPI003C7C67B7